MADPIFSLFLESSATVDEAALAELRRTLVKELVGRLPDGEILLRVEIKQSDGKEGHLNALYDVESEWPVMNGVHLAHAFLIAVVCWLSEVMVQQLLNIRSFSFSRLPLPDA